MSMSNRDDVWTSGDTYESYVGRWSRQVAKAFLRWLGGAPAQTWLDVGCGTGALSEAILARASPTVVIGVDPSASYLNLAQHRMAGRPARFVLGTAQRLPVASGAFDAVVSGLMLNFLPDPAQGLTELTRAARSEGIVAVYVWDYHGDMQMLRAFWDAAIASDPTAGSLDEGQRFPICRSGSLVALFEHAGLTEVDVRAIDVPTQFRDFNDYWAPFLGGQGPAPTYVAALDDDHRTALRERLRTTLPSAADGSINLIARAWAVRGTR